MSGNNGEARAKLDARMVTDLATVLEEIGFVQRVGSGNNDALGTLAMNLRVAADRVEALRAFQLAGGAK